MTCALVAAVMLLAGVRSVVLSVALAVVAVSVIGWVAVYLYRGGR